MSYRITYTPSLKAAEPLHLPRCKSLTARRLCLDRLSGRVPRLPGGEFCRDEELLACALESELRGEEVFVGESGTALRLLTALVAALPGHSVAIAGEGRLLSRPMRPLCEAIGQLGGAVPTLDAGRLMVQGRRLRCTEPLEIDASISSQFITALLLIGPLVDGGLTLRLRGRSVSQSYISMTLRVMEQYGALVSERLHGDVPELRVEPGRYVAPEADMAESDWSSASYFYETALLTSSPLALDSLVPPAISLQGDSRCVSLFGELGMDTCFRPGSTELIPALTRRPSCLRAGMASTPDLVPSLAVACVGAGIPFEFTGVGHLRHKESDRIEALRMELAKMGVELRVGSDSVACAEPGSLKSPSAPLSAHGDHRIAMALAPLACRFPIEIEGTPQVVDKSFPGFWRQLVRIGFMLHT